MTTDWDPDVNWRTLRQAVDELEDRGTELLPSYRSILLDIISNNARLMGMAIRAGHAQPTAWGPPPLTTEQMKQARERAVSSPPATGDHEVR